MRESWKTEEKKNVPTILLIARSWAGMAEMNKTNSTRIRRTKEEKKKIKTRPGMWNESKSERSERSRYFSIWQNIPAKHSHTYHPIQQPNRVNCRQTAFMSKWNRNRRRSNSHSGKFFNYKLVTQIGCFFFVFLICRSIATDPNAQLKNLPYIFWILFAARPMSKYHNKEKIWNCDFSRRYVYSMECPSWDRHNHVSGSDSTEFQAKKPREQVSVPIA